MKVEETKMKVEKIYVRMNDEKRKLSVDVDVEVFDKIFDNDEDALMMEVEMIIENLGNDIEKKVRFEKSDENYDVYLNDEKYEFDY